MEKVINLEFNSSGVLVSHDEGEIRQGDKGVLINAIFEGKNNLNYIARLNLTRSDGEQSVNNLMVADATVHNKYTKVLDSEWYFAKEGEATLTVFLVDGSGNQLANGQVTIAVQKTDYSGDPTITPDEYQELLEEIAKKLNIVDGIIKTSSISDLGNLDQYNVGQVFFVKNNLDAKLWQLNSSYNLDLVFDFKYVDAGRVASINLVLSRNAINNMLTLQLLDKNSVAIASANITIHPASITNAGLMSAEDKVKLNDLPTGAEIEQTYETKEEAEESHEDLQEQIDAIVSKSDVVDVVGTHAELLAYDTSKLGNNDIIKVLVDETKNNQRSYYRWLKDDEEFEYVGSEGEYYTKSESDTIFLKKVDAVNIYQRKVIYSETEPANPEENDLWVNQTMELDEDVVIGAGLSLTEVGGVKTLKSDAVRIYQHSIRFSANGSVYKMVLINNSALAIRNTGAIEDALIKQIRFNLFFDESSTSGTLSLRPIISFEVIATQTPRTIKWHFYTMNAGEMTDTEIDPMDVASLITDNVVEL